MKTRTAPRSAFTLLEVLLASAISVMLMGGLYYAMDACLQQMDAGREVVQQSSLARAIFVRISNDLTASLAPIAPPTSGGSSSGSTSTSGGTPGATDPSMTDSSMTNSVTANGQIIFQIGVKGDSSMVAIYETRLSRAVVRPANADSQTAFAPDIRRICYFMTDSGLARQEIKMVTAEQVDQYPSEPDEFTNILAGEVKQFSVSYFDGTNWTDTWDGSTAGPDGVTPLGPPRCIEITLGIQVPGSDALKTFKHVISFPSAPGAPTTTDSSTTP